MGKPIVAVVGRPNVGKSTLFNRFAGERISIVEDTPGVTRDRIDAEVEWTSHKFMMIDTGGLEPDSEEEMHQEIIKQAELAMEMADVILFIVDGQQGLMDDDIAVASILRRTEKPVVLAVNKIDNKDKYGMLIYEFYELGLGDPMSFSAEQGLGTGDLLDAIVSHFPEDYQREDDEDAIKVAVVGKPNVGKSSIINRIVGEERHIVSNTPGTTRDAVDSHLTKDGQDFIFIDTAGIRRKSRIDDETIERYSIIRAIAAIERADVVVLVISAEEGITSQDTKIAGIAYERGKPTVVAVNKWDMIEKDNKTMRNYLNEIEVSLSYMPYAPKLFISAKTGQRFNRLYELIVEVNESSEKRIATGILNEVLIEAMSQSPPKLDKGRQLKIYYMTQVSIKPPTFIMFVNDSQNMHFSYKRYIENQIRQAFGFKGTPIHFIVRNKNED